jgi:oligoribonuclease
MRQPVERQQDPTNLAWLDLEMTGLDAEQDAILQAALIITNVNLEPLEQFSCDIWQPAAMLEKMTPFVRDMHEQSGLASRVRASRMDVRSAERELLERIAGWCPFPAVLAGNTIGQDRRFINRWMAGLDAYLHYRMLDVTALKLVARLWYGESAVYQKPAEAKHDACVDVRNSIAELAHYRATLFRVTGSQRG